MSLFLVPDELSGERLDAVAARVSGYSRTKIVDLVSAGKVRINSELVLKPSMRVNGGELLELQEQEIKKNSVTVRPQLADGLEVSYEDQDILVVDKPVGVAAHPSLGW
ncbi:MAG: RNA pseudouridine synthase, partial [Propionibacterium sp.]